ncbi:MAG: EAL domain-containing protein [Cyanobacteriota bacterium ELA615]
MDNKSTDSFIAGNSPPAFQESFGEDIKLSAFLDNTLLGVVFTGDLQSSSQRFMRDLLGGCHELTGYQVSELKSLDYHSIVHPEDLLPLQIEIEKAIANQQSYEIEYRIFTKNGQQKWILEKAKTLKNSLQGLLTDISRLKVGELIISKQVEVLETIARGSHLDEILQQLVKLVKEVALDLFCSIMLANAEKTHLSCHSASNLPLELKQQLQELPIGSQYQCPEFKKRFLDHDLHSFLSFPIVSSTCELFGNITIYYHQSNATNAGDIKLLETVAYLAGIALEANQMKLSLQQAETKYRTIFENINQGIFQYTSEGYYLSANPALLKIYGCQSIHELSQRNTIDGIYIDPDDKNRLFYLLEKDGHVENFESQIYQTNGNIVWVSQNIRAVCDQNGDLLYYEGTVEEITKRRQAEEQLIYQVYNDALTGLRNRNWLIEKLKTMISISKKQSSYQYALLFVDLDGFKLINDSLGHSAGDKLLYEVSQRLSNLLSQEQSLSRLSGDEFVILIENFQKIEEVLELVNKLQKMFVLPFNLNQEKIFANCSIGITIGKSEYRLPEQILRDADVAMYQAKSKGKGTYAFFSSAVQNSLINRLQIENELYGALDRGELNLHYQPIYTLTTGRLSGFEALLRWEHPNKGLISPAYFIPLMEEMGLIKTVGLWTFRQACQQIKQWKSQYQDLEHLSLNVNFSIYQFRQADLLEQISEILQDVGIEGHHLKVEITESAIMETLGNEISILEGLRDLGIRLCIDDFGTGYSSLSRLHDLPIDTVKIDQSFVRFMDTNDNIIVKTIITLAHALNMNVVAEGVENIIQLKQLVRMRCEMGQGYLFSRPVDAKIASKLVAFNANQNISSC